ncbi:MAG: 3-dehydroquinate synthase [Blastocatellia bacterium]|jgi:3-dehydroquinate synthase|nr:3-dehydroquinate synthase [Blastocatellia bacterium]
MPVVPVRLPARQEKYEIKIGAGLLSQLGPEVRVVLGADSRRIALISNPTVFAFYGKRALQSLKASKFKTVAWLMPEGEQHKTLSSWEQALAFLSESGLERGDAVVTLGGGVVGDLAGFAAATYLRGIAFFQVPTTLLAQIDASVGGKTGVNLTTGKNLVGAFHQPRLVIIDTLTLATLPGRELTSGWCEAVKQGAVGSRKLFAQTRRLLNRSGTDFSLWLGREESQSEVCATIAAHCNFKAAIVAGDEREEIGRADHRSRRILNFGHTTAHALEKLTGYRRFRHGEAVGYGMLVAGEISKNIGMLASGELESLRDTVRLCGPLPAAHDLSIDEIISAMKGDKKSLGGVTMWVLLDRIGRARIIDGKQIDKRILRLSLRAGLRDLS